MTAIKTIKPRTSRPTSYNSTVNKLESLNSTSCCTLWSNAVSAEEDCGIYCYFPFSSDSAALATPDCRTLQPDVSFHTKPSDSARICRAFICRFLLILKIKTEILLTCKKSVVTALFAVLQYPEERNFARKLLYRSAVTISMSYAIRNSDF